VDLVRRVARAQVFGWTFPLLTTASGAKMGKTEKGAVWLDPNKTSPYEYYQYWINIDDRDVAKCLGLFTLLPLEEVRRLSALKDAETRKAKQVLAYETTKLIHGEEEARKAQSGASMVFEVLVAPNHGEVEASAQNLPTSPVSSERLNEGLLLADVLNEFGLTKSKSEGRRLIEQGGVTVNIVKVIDPHFKITRDHAKNGAILLRIGKKRYHRLEVKD
jgi:tyrosyl-tRNA synthetase